MAPFTTSGWKTYAGIVLWMASQFFADGGMSPNEMIEVLGIGGAAAGLRHRMG